ncbi:MAG: hypothetical protein ACOCUL_03255, partial [Bacteroidota bacterium]
KREMKGVFSNFPDSLLPCFKYDKGEDALLLQEKFDHLLLHYFDKEKKFENYLDSLLLNPVNNDLVNFKFAFITNHKYLVLKTKVDPFILKGQVQTIGEKYDIAAIGSIDTSKIDELYKNVIGKEVAVFNHLGNTNVVKIKDLKIMAKYVPSHEELIKWNEDNYLPRKITNDIWSGDGERFFLVAELDVDDQFKALYAVPTYMGVKLINQVNQNDSIEQVVLEKTKGTMAYKVVQEQFEDFAYDKLGFSPGEWINHKCSQQLQVYDLSQKVKLGVITMNTTSFFGFKAGLFTVWQLDGKQPILVTQNFEKIQGPVKIHLVMHEKPSFVVTGYNGDALLVKKYKGNWVVYNALNLSCYTCL